MLIKELDASPDWTAIVPMNLDDDQDRLTDLLSYNRITGRSVYSIGTGTENDLQKIVSDISDPAARGWTTIVPLHINDDGLTDLVWYNERTGRVVYTIATGAVGPGSVSNQRIVFDVATPEAIGWTSIVMMQLNDDQFTDILSYNKQTGRAVYSIGTGVPDDPQKIVKDINIDTGWTSIVPMTLPFSSGDLRRSGLFFYNEDDGRAQITRHCELVC
jgi:hypothetical protein